MTRALFILVIMMFSLTITAAVWAGDLSLNAVQYLGPDYHFKGAIDPTANLRIVIELADGERPASRVAVQIDLYETAGPASILTETVNFDISSLTNPGDTLESLVEIPLYDGTHRNYPLNQGEYVYEVLLHLEDDIPDNNTAQSPVFEYRILSGNLYFGDVLTSLTPTASGVEVDSAACTPDPYRIIAGTGNWSHSWGSNSLSYFNLCAVGTVNISDNYTVDLRVTNGSVSVGSLSSTVASLGVALAGVSLNPTGMNYTGAAVDLPDEVTVHERPTGNLRINPIGASRLTFSGGGPVVDPQDIALSASTDRYFHGYGLPFYIYAQGGVFFPLESGSPGLVLENPDPYYVQIDTWATMKQEDKRKKAGLPSNDVLFQVGDATESIIDGNGLQSTCNFLPASAMFNSVGLSARMHFPFGKIEWEGFDISIQDGEIAPAIVSDVVYTMTFLGECPECPGPLKPPPVDYTTTLGTAALDSDGSLGGVFPGLAKPTAWGQINSSGVTTYSKDDTLPNGVLSFPGFVAADTASSHTLSQYLMGSREFPLANDPGTMNYSNGAAAKAGNGYFAGITMGPAELEPSVKAGVSASLTNTQLNVLFDGNTAASPFTVTAHTKYVMRPGGLTGVFNTNFSGNLTVYGYPLDLERFAFRQKLNVFDDETLVDGKIDLPEPAGIRVYFRSLNVTCTGNLTDGDVDNETACDGNNDDSDGWTDEGCYQALKYWNVPIKYLGMGFEDPNGKKCPSGNQKLKLVTSNQVNGVNKRLTLTSFWEPKGKPLKDNLTGPAQLVMDASHDGKKKGFGVQVKKGYLNRPIDQNNDGSPDWGAAEPSEGFTNVITRTDVPLFDDPILHGHFKNDKVDTQGQVDKDDYDLYLFKDQSASDSDWDGIPLDGTSSDYNVTYMKEYRDMLDCKQRELKDCNSSYTQPDPRPSVEYTWPSSGIIELDYPLRYQEATSDKGPQFLGIKKETNLPKSSPTILKVYSVPNYIKPARTKVSFGASADLADLKNMHIALAAAGVNAFFKDALGIDLSIDLDDLFDARDEMLKLVGADLTPIIGSAIEEGLKVGDVSTPIGELADELKTIHGAPAKITSLVQNPILSPGQKAKAILYDKKDKNGTKQADGLIKKLKKIYSDANLAALIVYDENNPQASPPSGVNLADLKKSMAAAKSDLSALLKVLADGRKAIESASGKIKALKDSVNNAQTKALTAIGEIKTDLGEMSTYFSKNQNDNPILTGMKDARKALKDVKDALKDIKKIEQQIDKVNDWIFKKLKGQIDATSAKQVVKWVKDKLPQLEALLTKADVYYQAAINQTPFDQIFNDSKSKLTLLNSHVGGLSAQITGGVLDNTKDALLMAEKGLQKLCDHLKNLQELLQAKTKSNATTWSGLVADGKYRLNQHAKDTLDALKDFQPVDLAGVPIQLKNLNEEAKKLYTKATAAADAFPIYAGGLAALVDAPLRDGSKQFTAQLASVNKALQNQIPSAKAEDIRGIIRTAAVNSSPARKINAAFFGQFDYISDYFDDLIKGISKHLNRLINDLVAAASKDLSNKLSSITSAIGSKGIGGLSAAKIDGYAIVSQDEVERFHLEAEIGYDTKPEPTKFHAGIDYARWRAVNGRASECCQAGNNLIDVSIFTNNVPVKLMGGKLKIKKALLGFILKGAIPQGAFGQINFKGGYKRDNVKLEDLGAIAGVTWGSTGSPIEENYLGGKCRGKFSDFKVQAAFFVGESCKLNVLRTLDKNVTDYIGKSRTKIRGFYARASGRVPLYKIACLFKLGVGAELGFWYFDDPPPMWGGILGGSIYGTVACVASGKGLLSLGGSKTAGQLTFAGAGWAAAGFGFCEPEDWKTVKDSRDDGWCATWDAYFKAKYVDSWDVSDSDTSGPH